MGDYIKKICTSSDHGLNIGKSFKDIGIQLQEELRTQDTYSIYSYLPE